MASEAGTALRRIEGGSKMESSARTEVADEPLTLELRSDGQLWATRPDRDAPVWVFRCFPWTAAGRFVSLRDEDEEEFALVRDPEALDERSRGALERALLEAGFVLEVERILEVEEEVEIRPWRVETRQGPRRFQTLRDEWPREVPGGGLLIRDVAGDLFWIPDPAGLDAHSRREIWAFVD